MDPFHSDRPDAHLGNWDDLIDAVSPASLLVVIRGWMSDGLRARLAPEDILQETLLQAWRDRTQLTWQGLSAFRRWLLGIARHRILDAETTAKRLKRGAGQREVLLSELLRRDDGSSSATFAGPVATSSPGRIAQEREKAERMAAALATLPADLQNVLRLRLFEELKIEEIAARLGVGESGVRHRFRRAAALYQERLQELITTTGR